jgi:hypothetical protein
MVVSEPWVLHPTGLTSIESLVNRLLVARRGELADEK